MNNFIPEKYRHDEEIIRLTIGQLEKDFGKYFPKLHFSGQKELLFEELTEKLAEKLQAIHKESPAVLKSILYRVDVREQDVPGSSKKDFYRELSMVILRREFGKVLTRRFFGQKP